ncbi:hypothetical protein ABIA31_001921 [Catenulispora sp. MAP5-51]
MLGPFDRVKTTSNPVLVLTQPKTAGRWSEPNGPEQSKASFTERPAEARLVKQLPSLDGVPTCDARADAPGVFSFEAGVGSDTPEGGPYGEA